MHPIPLPRWARISIAACCVAIGLASSTVAGWLLVRGLELTEPDGTARLILTAAGLLMIVTELMAFFLVALLPAAKLYQLKAMGVALLLFEITTIFGTRLVLSDSADAAVTAHATRIENARLAIETRTADAEQVRAAGQRQLASDNAWARHLGAQAIQRADAMQRAIEPLREELADLQVAQRPTLQHALGPGLALAHSIAMPILVSTIGLTMFGVAGLMLRRAKPNDEMEPELPVSPEQQPRAPPVQSAPEHRTAVPNGTVPAVPPTVSPLHYWSQITTAIPLAAMSATPSAVASPAAETPVEAPAETVTAPESGPVPPAPVQPADDAGTADDAIVTTDEDRYQRLRAAALAGEIKPSVRALRDSGYGGTDTVRRYLQQLADEGVIAKNGQGYALATHRSDLN